MDIVHAFDLKWFLETDDQGRISVITSERIFCSSLASKLDTITLTKPKTACYRCKIKLNNDRKMLKPKIWSWKGRTLTFMISTSFVCSKDKREGTRSETEIGRFVSLYNNTDSADTAPLFIWGDEPERYPIICVLRVYNYKSLTYSTKCILSTLIITTYYVSFFIHKISSSAHCGHCIDYMIIGLKQNKKNAW